MNVDDLLQSVPSLLTRINGLEQELTKINKKVKKLEQIVQNLGVHLTDSEDDESDNSSKQGGI
jgi:seryl-tRNA synthetase